MTEKINGQQAAKLYLEGEKIQLLNHAGDWVDLNIDTRISLFLSYKDEPYFRIKPPFIKINGLEVPAPVKEPVPGKEYFFINGARQDGYERVMYSNSNFAFTLGCWESEKDIIKVVSAINQSFKE